MLKILNVIQFLLYALAVTFVVIGEYYRLRVKKSDKRNLCYKNGMLYEWIGLSLFFISMVLSAILFYKTNGYLNIH